MGDNNDKTYEEACVLAALVSAVLAGRATEETEQAMRLEEAARYAKEADNARQQRQDR